MSEPRKSRLVAGVVIVLVLLAGIAIGYFLHHAMPWRHGPPGFSVGGPPPGPPGAIKGRMLERLDRELKLTPISTRGSTRCSRAGRPTSAR